MLRFVRYYSRFQDARGGVMGLPGWARSVLLALALPGLVLAALAMVLFCVGIFVLLLLTAPAYRLLSGIGGRANSSAFGDGMVEATVVRSGPYDKPPQRPIEVKILES